MKLTDKSNEVLEYIRQNGGDVVIADVAEATGRTAKSIQASVTDLVKKGLATRADVAIEGEDKPEKHVVATDEGMTFVPSDDAE